MKTRIEYRLEKFKKKYRYNISEKTITIITKEGEELKIPIDLDIFCKTQYSYSIDKNNKIILLPTRRRASCDVGPYNIPVIHLSIEYFTSKYQLLNLVLYHEIYHMMNTTNMDNGKDFVNTSLSHTKVYNMYIDNIKQYVRNCKGKLDESRELYHQYFEEYDNNETNYKRYEIVMHIIDKIHDEYKFTKDKDISYIFKHVYEIEADIFSIVNTGFKEYKKYKKYHKRELNTIRFYERRKNKGLYRRKIVMDLLEDSYIKERLYIYKI